MSSVNIFEIEKHIFNERYEEAATLFNELVVDLRKGNHFSTALLPQKMDLDLTAIYTRLSRCISALFLDPLHYKMSFLSFSFWVLYGRELRAIFTIGGFYRTDALVEIVDNNLKHAIDRYSKGEDCLLEVEQLVMRILLLTMLETNTAVDFTIFYNFFPTITLTALMSLLSSNVVVTPQGSTKKEYLLGLTSLFEKLDISHPYHLHDITATWLQSSYALRRDKHQIKPYLNASITRWLEREHFLKDARCKQYDATLAKPTLLIVLEYFIAAHSMGRSYGAALISLKEKFNVVALALHPQEVSDHNYIFFDKVISFDSLEGSILNIDKLPEELQKIYNLNIDMIFYPSLGMHQFAIILANMRLAPIQMISFGHPASSFCEYIDYGIIEADYAPDADDLFSEKLIVLPPESFVSKPLDQLTHFKPRSKKANEVIYVAVSSVLAKISANFLQVCRKIAEASTQKITFLFFINEVEIFYLQCKKDILHMLPNSQVFYRLPIDTYLQHLDSCDIYLSTFPFGGANSVIDAMGVGLPIVCLRGEDIAGRTDSALIRRRGLPEWLITHSEAEYIAAALRLINNEEERVALSEFILARSQELFPQHNAHYQQQSHCFATACWQIYKKHAQLQKLPQKRFSFDELCRLTHESSQG